jgi:hypothetical protein
MELRELGEQNYATVDEEQTADLAKRFNSFKIYVSFCIDNDIKRENERKIHQSSDGLQAKSRTR